MSRTEHLHLFAGYGIEMEYMIVDRETLAVRPYSDRVLVDAAGKIENELEFADTAWSNELAMHVIEMKSNGPTADLIHLHELFARDVAKINAGLAPHGAMLMPTAMHPFMEPERDMQLWPHDNAEIYAAYNRIFDCRGHGWTNLQSVHINLPFYDDAEFGKLHAAVRLVLPLLPALAASSPIYGGKASGLMDSRLEFYRNNQRAVPAITGGVIPEQAFTKQEYTDKIFKKIYAAIAPLDPEGQLQDEWLNSRGAIARFDRNAIEIRVLDIQESPRMDLAVVTAVVSLVRGLVDGLWADQAAQRAWTPDPLRAVFLETVRHGGAAVIRDRDYLRLFGLDQAEATARDVWAHLIGTLNQHGGYPLNAFKAELAVLMEEGCLAERILRAVGPGAVPERVAAVYRQLCDVLAAGGIFHGAR